MPVTISVTESSVANRAMICSESGPASISVTGHDSWVEQTSDGGAPTGPKRGPTRRGAVGNVAPARGDGTDLGRHEVGGQNRTVSFGELWPSGDADHDDALGEEQGRHGRLGQGMDAAQGSEEDSQHDEQECPAAAQW